MRPFHNVRPQDRRERHFARNRQMLEKSRLAQRREGYERHVVSYNPVSTVPGAPAHDESRFLAPDAATVERRIRKQERRDVEARRQNLVDMRAQREELRWEKMDAERQLRERRLTKTIAGKNVNHSSVQYDLVNLRPGQEAEARIRYESDAAVYRGAKRAQHLYHQQHREGINPITGQALQLPIDVPEPPVRPF